MPSATSTIRSKVGTNRRRVSKPTATSAVSRRKVPEESEQNSLLASIAITFILLLGRKAVGAEAAAPVSNPYPRSQLLASTSDLTATPNRLKLVVLDARSQEKYEAGHTPGAIRIDAAAWGAAVNDDRDPKSWTRRFSTVGLNRDSAIIVYDDQRQRDAARVWWILRLWGVPHARVLNGGWPAYAAAAGIQETGVGRSIPPGNIIATRNSNVFASKELLLTAHHEGRLGKPGKENLQIIDARSDGEFCGTSPSRTKHQGTIPGAKHLEWSDLLIPETAQFKSADELRQLFERAGIDLDSPSATFCQGGGRAAVLAFGLELMGAPAARNYYASWGEWGNADDAPFIVPKSTKDSQ